MLAQQATIDQSFRTRIMDVFQGSESSKVVKRQSNVAGGGNQRTVASD